MITNYGSFLIIKNLKGGQFFLTLSLFFLLVICSNCSNKEMEGEGALLITFPINNSELTLVFSIPVEQTSAERSDSYTTDEGLTIIAATIDPLEPTHVKLKTEAMVGDSMKIDIVRATGVRTSTGARLVKDYSPKFIHGIASISEIQEPAEGFFHLPHAILVQ